MSDIIEYLVIQLKEELEKVCKEHKELNDDNAQSFYEWMKVEYVNYMMLSKSTCLVTLDRLEERYSEYKSLIDILRNNINEYGSIQAYYRVALKLLN